MEQTSQTAAPIFAEINRHTGEKTRYSEEAMVLRLYLLGHKVDEVMTAMKADQDVEGVHATFRKDNA